MYAIDAMDAIGRQLKSEVLNYVIKKHTKLRVRETIRSHLTSPIRAQVGTREQLWYRRLSPLLK